ncbi:MAG: site-specific DNA-methyltransferase [bacterium]
MTSQSPADVAFCSTKNNIQKAKDIFILFEVKMSIAWNWELLHPSRNEELICLGDYKTHKGSWLSAANPVLRDIHEYILVFSKESFSRIRKDKENTIRKEEFLEWTKSVWTFSAVSARQIGHPAPFPEELPYRLIQLYSFKNDIVIDPFLGSGTTCLSALKSNRNYVGYDINKEYVKLACRRIENHQSQISLFD